MKNTFLFVGLVFLTLACSEGIKKTDPVAETTPKLALPDAVEEENPMRTLPFYNYTELEAEFFQQKEGPLYVINFWATWCKPCVKELPAFEELQATYQDQNVQVILVSLDFPEKVQSRVIPFIEEHDLKSRVVLLDDPDANSWIPAISMDWSGAIPATLMVKNGSRKFYERSFTYAELETELKTIL